MIFRFCHNQRKPPKCLYIKHFCGFNTFRNLHFRTNFNQNSKPFSATLPWASFLLIWGRLGANKIDFGSPWRQAGYQKGGLDRPGVSVLGALFQESNFRWHLETTLPLFCSFGLNFSSLWAHVVSILGPVGLISHYFHRSWIHSARMATDSNNMFWPVSTTKI